MGNLVRQATPILILLAICAVMIGGIVWVMNSGGDGSEPQLSEDAEPLPGPLTADELAAYDVGMSNTNNPVAVLETNQGTIEIELYENQMPITAGNFAKLVEEGYYDGTKFHRIIEGFMIQGGDPITKTDEVLRYGTGGPGYTIPDEHIEGELLTNVRGTISMANSGPESGGSQFFINLVDNQNLDFNRPPLSSQHPVFGRVINGMDVVDDIGRTEVTQTALPLEDVVIEQATIRRSE